MSKQNPKIAKFLEEHNHSEFEKPRQADSLAPTVDDVANQFKKNRNVVEINNRKYTIKKFGIRDTITLIPILGNTLVVPLSACVKEGDDTMSGITEALFLLFGNMENGKFMQIMELLLSNTTIEGRDVDIDEDFDDIGDLFKVCVKVMEISFTPFLKSLDLSQMTGWFQKIQLLA